MEIKVNVNFTESAITELKRAKESMHGPADDLVRVSVTGGGCSGFMYGMNFVPASSVNENDFIEEHDGIQVVIDKKSLLYLDGTTVDWHEDLTERGFKFENPNAVKSCGCGKSFG